MRCWISHDDHRNLEGNSQTSGFPQHFLQLPSFKLTTSQLENLRIDYLVLGCILYAWIIQGSKNRPFWAEIWHPNGGSRHGLDAPTSFFCKQAILRRGTVCPMRWSWMFYQQSSFGRKRRTTTTLAEEGGYMNVILLNVDLQVGLSYFIITGVNLFLNLVVNTKRVKK